MMMLVVSEEGGNTQRCCQDNYRKKDFHFETPSHIESRHSRILCQRGGISRLACLYNLPPKSHFARSQQSILPRIPPQKVIGLCMRGVVLARLPDFMQQKRAS